MRTRSASLRCARRVLRSATCNWAFRLARCARSESACRLSDASCCRAVARRVSSAYRPSTAARDSAAIAASRARSDVTLCDGFAPLTAGATSTARAIATSGRTRRRGVCTCPSKERDRTTAFAEEIGSSCRKAQVLRAFRAGVPHVRPKALVLSCVLVTHRPLPVRPSRPQRGVASRKLGRAPYVLVGICIALLAAVPAFADPSISSKKAEAQQVMDQLRSLSDSLERARSQYGAANARLAKIQRDLRENKHELGIARHNLKSSQRTIAARLVALYTSSDQESTLEVILGARSFDDMITRMDNAKAVTKADAH